MAKAPEGNEAARESAGTKRCITHRAWNHALFAWLDTGYRDHDRSASKRRRHVEGKRRSALPRRNTLQEGRLCWKHRNSHDTNILKAGTVVSFCDQASASGTGWPEKGASRPDLTSENCFHSLMRRVLFCVMLNVTGHLFDRT